MQITRNTGKGDYLNVLMLEIRKTSITLDETDFIEFERIITNLDEKEVLQYLRKAIYKRIEQAQQGKLKSHLDGNNRPAEKFRQGSNY